MSRPISCQGDGILCITCKDRPLNGTILTVSSTRTFCRGRPVVLDGDFGICKLPTRIKATQFRCIIEGRSACRLGDLNTCTGPILGPGDPTVFIGE
jgi:uncharacterized Zn-binding protein involved in type VI secretion